jgi:hypothetical protein
MNIVLDCSYFSQHISSPYLQNELGLIPLVQKQDDVKHKLSLQNIFFQEKKNNIIIDGTFTKIVYSTNWFSTNGIYLYIPFIYASTQKRSSVFRPETPLAKKKNNKQYIDLDTTQPINYNIIQSISDFEDIILKYYKKTFQIEKSSSYTLRNQLTTGTINISVTEQEPVNSEPAHFGAFNSLIVSDEEPVSETKYILKISGIWENNHSIGITYKFIQMKKFT